MKVGIIVNDTKKDAELFASKLVSLFQSRNIGVFVSNKRDKSVDEMYENADIIISIGGDGTFLRAASRTLERGIPIVGFNLGTLGFLTELDRENIEEVVDRIAKGDYQIEERRVLSVNVITNDKKEFFGYAINDVVVTREADSGVPHLSVDLRGVHVDTYPCDGIIVATQTGSTGYALSAGGPIVEPGNDIVLITAICSHKMGSRAIVARPESEIKITPVKFNKLRLIVDGNKSQKIENNQYVVCEPTDKKIRIVRMDPPNFYRAVEKKLLGGGL